MLGAALDMRVHDDNCTSFRPHVQHRPSASPMTLWQADGPAATHITFTSYTGNTAEVMRGVRLAACKSSCPRYRPFLIDGKHPNRYVLRSAA